MTVGRASDAAPPLGARPESLSLGGGGVCFTRLRALSPLLLRTPSLLMRGSDELLSQSTSVTVSNGGMMSPQNNHSDNNNEAKKVKLDKSNQSNRPSRVIHIRSIPSDVAETEIIQMGMPFGRVTNVLVLKGKNQAFLEMADEVSAKSMVDYFPNNMAQLRGRSVFIQYSNHKELKTDSTHSNAQHVNTQAALHAAQALVNHNHSSNEQVQGGPNSVLRVMVEQMLYPVNLDVLSTIFSRVGKVLKIVTFTKNNTFQALIQYPDAVTAQNAKLSLDGQNIYNSCCTLRIEYSKLTHLNVKYNNDKSRDYTNHNLPTGDIALDSALAIGGSGVFSSSPFAVHGLGAPLAAYTQAVGGSCYASLNYTPSPLTGFMLPSPNSSAALGMAGIRIPGQPQTGCVLLVNNLNEETVTPDALFTLFGVYGDVFRVKILFNRKDNALIQMAETHQAQLAKTHLDKIKVFGKHMRVMASKHQSVQMPKEGQPDTGLTKDYTNSGLHRFKKPGSKNYQNIYPPSSTLHLSNIPPNVSEEDITQAFIRNNCVVKAFKFFAKDRKMALVQMGSMEEAVMALIKMHNFQLSESSHLRVSFSKSTI